MAWSASREARALSDARYSMTIASPKLIAKATSPMATHMTRIRIRPRRRRDRRLAPRLSQGETRGDVLMSTASRRCGGSVGRLGLDNQFAHHLYGGMQSGSARLRCRGPGLG